MLQREPTVEEEEEESENEMEENPSNVLEILAGMKANDKYERRNVKREKRKWEEWN